MDLKKVLEEIRGIVKSDVSLRTYNSGEVVMEIFETDLLIIINFKTNTTFLDCETLDSNLYYEDLVDVVKVMKLIEDNIELFRFKDFSED